jgi:sugar-specific transcriptional regulator TrmB
LSLEIIVEALIGLGLSRFDAEVYVFLAKRGSQTAAELADSLNTDRQKIYLSLKNLSNKGLVTKNRVIFSALPFEEALDLLIKLKKKKVLAIHESMKAISTTGETKDNHGS